MRGGTGRMRKILRSEVASSLLDNGLVASDCAELHWHLRDGQGSCTRDLLASNDEGATALGKETKSKGGWAFVTVPRWRLHIRMPLWAGNWEGGGGKGKGRLPEIVIRWGAQSLRSPRTTHLGLGHVVPWCHRLRRDFWIDERENVVRGGSDEDGSRGNW